ncbi:hypothetical protein [Curtobacterium sp. RRHDQ10]|uniref:hypothetical protein n=1 Tax=Curtobacterium phyllosphaerae TaxID=3413379 RepID=UPI003BEF5BD9
MKELPYQRGLFRRTERRRARRRARGPPPHGSRRRRARRGHGRGRRTVRSAGGSVIVEFPAGTDDTGGATAEAEILRGDLAEIVIGSTDGVGYRFGDRITAIDDPTTKRPATADTDALATASFEHAPDEEFDLVVTAEGLRSATRRMVFGPEVQLRPLGLQCTFLTIPRTEAAQRGGSVGASRRTRVGVDLDDLHARVWSR